MRINQFEELDKYLSGIWQDKTVNTKPRTRLRYLLFSLFIQPVRKNLMVFLMISSVLVLEAVLEW